MRRLVVSVTMLTIVLPFSAFALEGIGPRVTITGAVESANITAQNKMDEYGGEIKVRASNGQLVTVVMTKETDFIAEGRAGRKPILPENLTKGMDVRIRGWRLGTDGMTASLVIIANVSLNPTLSTNGILQSIDETGITIIGQNGVVSQYQLTNETEVSIAYTLRGMEGLRLVGKEVLLTLNPNNPSQARAVRITGNKETSLQRPTTLQFNRRSY